MTNSNPSKRSNTWRLRLGERRLLLFLGDLFMGMIALGISLVYWGSTLKFIEFNLEFLRTRVPLWFYLLPFVWTILLIDLYDIHQAGNWNKTIKGITIAAIALLGLYLIIYVVYVEPPRSILPRRGVASFLILVVIFTLLWRRFYIRIFTAPEFMRMVLLVGGGETGKIFLRVFNGLKPKPFNLVGIIDDDLEKHDQLIEGQRIMGASDTLLEVIEEYNITDLIVAITGEMNGDMFQALLDAREGGVEIDRFPVAYEELLGRVPIQWLEADWILKSFIDRARSRGFYELWKRLIDILGGLIGCLGLLLFLPFVAIIQLIDDGFPIFYTQVRSGRGDVPYRILKFRTMRRDAEANGQPQWASDGDQRATRFGAFLRKTHLDELPQFMNVLRGEMSLVGPRAERPELVEHFQKYVPFYRARLLVKPGITGWAQVNFGYAATIEETGTKLEFDLYYIENRNLLLDLVILLRTPGTMMGFRGR